MKKMIIVALVILIIIISSCTYQSTKQPTITQTSQNNENLGIKQDISITGFAFNPKSITIPKGATVIWTNLDSAEHTIISDNGNEINSNPILKSETFAHTFNTKGTYDYHCGIHPSMKGKIIVE